VYTGRVAWATIRSQDVAPSETESQDGHFQDERNPPQDSGGPVVLSPSDIFFEPCSPKSIYRLADKVRLATLWMMRLLIAFWIRST
jgi:hypothetical protein